MTANEVTKKIKDYLNQQPKTLVWRNTTAPVRGRKYTGRKGVGDLIGISDGVHIEIEVKVGKDIMRPEQYEHRGAVLRCGGVYYIAHSFLEFYLWWTEDYPEDQPF